MWNILLTSSGQLFCLCSSPTSCAAPCWHWEVLDLGWAQQNHNQNISVWLRLFSSWIQNTVLYWEENELRMGSWGVLVWGHYLSSERSGTVMDPSYWGRRKHRTHFHKWQERGSREVEMAQLLLPSLWSRSPRIWGTLKGLRTASVDKTETGLMGFLSYEIICFAESCTCWFWL